LTQLFFCYESSVDVLWVLGMFFQNILPLWFLLSIIPTPEKYNHQNIIGQSMTNFYQKNSLPA